MPLMLLLCASVVFGFKEQSVQELIDRAQAASPQDRIGIDVEIMELQLKTAEQLYRQGKANDAKAAVADIVRYADEAHDSAIATSKKIKGTEISFRKVAKRLLDLKGALDYDNQAPVQAAADHLEQLRSDLLNRMFAKD
jgi:hypothetical protein